MMLEQALKKLEEEFTVSKEEILTVASRFQEQMAQGLEGRESSLQMLPSYLRSPDGREAGYFLALDFGGSNARAALIELKGEGMFLEARKLSRPLVDPAAGINYCAAEATEEELFDFLAGLIQEVLPASLLNSGNTGSGTNSSGPLETEAKILPLGFTFSFAYKQETLEEGILLSWNKEVRTSGVEGRDVAKLLAAALGRRGLAKVVRPVAVINDTTANFLTAAYQDAAVNIASIIGTGHNTCYLETNAPGFSAPLIVNTEAGNFAFAPETGYDRILDQESDNPGRQLLEKKISAKYLGELFRQIVGEFSRRGLLEEVKDLSGGVAWDVPYSLSGKDMAELCSGRDAASLCGAKEAQGALPCVARLLMKRSARLAAAGLLGVIRHLDPGLERRHIVAMDGSLYTETSGYAQELAAALDEMIEPKVGLVTVKVSAGGSLIGAGIAAALAGRAEGKGIRG